MAVALLASLTMGPGTAILLFSMFAGQLISPYVVESLNLPELPWGNATDGLHQLFSAAYVVLFLAIVWLKRRDVWALRHGASVEQRIVEN